MNASFTQLCLFSLTSFQLFFYTYKALVKSQRFMHLHMLFPLSLFSELSLCSPSHALGQTVLFLMLSYLFLLLVVYLQLPQHSFIRMSLEYMQSGAEVSCSLLNVLRFFSAPCFLITHPIGVFVLHNY